MNDFDTLSAVVNLGAGSVKLDWSLAHFSEADGAIIVSTTIKRSAFGSETESIIATTAGNFAGSTYTDTPATRGQYRYKLVVVIGTAPDTILKESNNVAVSTITAVVLTSVVSGNTVTLSWTTGSGPVVLSTVQRSANGGVNWVDVRHINGALGNTFTETLSNLGDYLYRVLVVLPPAACDAPGQTPTLFSNTTVGVDVPGGEDAEPEIDLGLASGFAILAGSTVTNTGGTVVIGDLGLSPGSSVTGFFPIDAGPGNVVGDYHITDTEAANAQLALTAAYNDAAGRAGGTPVAGNLGGQTLAPGIYKSVGSLEVSSGNLTLDGGGDANAFWIFQIATTLIVSPGLQVILAGGAQAKNIFWQVGSSATLDTTSVFKGTIMADQSITVNTGASVEGRLLASIAAVTLDTNAVTLSV